mmetsp:Transcript_33887/g.106268  ORF Transcript_33887/g.106268 Transcript_33887/m.106268 type:complete len:203 (-) Transcript_33887:10-618(-)
MAIDALRGMVTGRRRKERDSGICCMPHTCSSWIPRDRGSYLETLGESRRAGLVEADEQIVERVVPGDLATSQRRWFLCDAYLHDGSEECTVQSYQLHKGAVGNRNRRDRQPDGQAFCHHQRVRQVRSWDQPRCGGSLEKAAGRVVERRGTVSEPQVSSFESSLSLTSRHGVMVTPRELIGPRSRISESGSLRILRLSPWFKY